MTPEKPVRAASKSARVRKLLRSKMTAAAIARRVGCTVGLVYNIKSDAGRTGTKRRTARRRRAAAASGAAATAGIDGILAAVRAAGRDRAQLRSTLQRIHAIVTDALA